MRFADQGLAVSSIRTAHLFAGRSLDLRHPRLAMVIEGVIRSKSGHAVRPPRCLAWRPMVAQRPSAATPPCAGHLDACEHGLRTTLPVSKGDRARKGVQAGIPYGVSDLCPVRALARWRATAGMAAGPVFWRI